MERKHVWEIIMADYSFDFNFFFLFYINFKGIKLHYIYLTNHKKTKQDYSGNNHMLFIKIFGLAYLCRLWQTGVTTQA